MPLVKKEQNPEDILDELLQNKARIEEIGSDEDEEWEDAEDDDEEEDEADDSALPPPEHQATKRSQQSNLPTWLQSAALNLFHEDLVTTTSKAQQEVTNDCLPLLTLADTQGLEPNSRGLPHLRREAHAQFLHAQLNQLPPAYQAADASRPWLFYWSIAGLSFLGEDVSHFRDRLMETVRPLQNPGGGFGGGHGQLSHCAGTYATVLALACVGGLEVVDRRAMWHWLGQVKQSDGGFCMAVGAEEDIRGAYCAMTVITLLNLPLELPPDAVARKEAGLTSFLDRLGEWVGRCQTHEGGIAGALTNEAHGAYAFCALGCLSIIDAPHISIPKYLDAQALVSWLAARQTQPEGGFQGRQEKLVDACYSHWVGGCWDLIQAGLSSGTSALGSDIWNREALIRYLLTCCQAPGKKGGMRDKPSTRPDGYHTCYSIAGLSHAQNHYHYDNKAPAKDEQSGRLLAAFNWTASPPTEEEMLEWKIDKQDLVEFVHPVFVIPMGVVEATRRQFAGGGF